MKAILHLMAKDLRRYGAFAALVITVIVLAGAREYFGIQFTARPSSLASALLQMLTWPLVFLFVVAVVQEDSVSGGKSFWVTRPIWPGELLAAKFILLFVVLVVPYGLAQGGFALAVKSSAALATAVAFEAAGFMLLVTLGSMLAGALTRFTLQACALIVSVFVVFWLSAVLVDGRSDSFLHRLPWSPAREISGDTALVVLITSTILALFVVLSLHYRRRSLRLTLAAIGTAFVIVFVTLTAWRHDFLPRASAPGATTLPTVAAPAGFDVVAQSNTADVAGLWRQPTGNSRNTALYRRAVLRVAVTSPTNGQLATITTSAAQLRWADGTTRTLPPIPNLRSDQFAVDHWLRRHLGFPLKSVHSQIVKLNVAALPEELTKETLPPGTTLAAGLQVTLDACEQEAVLPLAAGTSFWLRDSLLQINGATLETSGKRPLISVKIRVLRAKSILRPYADQHPNLSRSIWGPITNRQFVLYNRARNEFSLGWANSLSTGSGLSSSSFEGTLNFQLRLGRDMTRPVDDFPADWLAGAELWILHRVPVGQFTHPLSVPDFRHVAASPTDPDLWSSDPRFNE